MKHSRYNSERCSVCQTRKYWSLFEKSVSQDAFKIVRRMLTDDPSLINEVVMPRSTTMIDILIQHGATAQQMFHCAFISCLTSKKNLCYLQSLGARPNTLPPLLFDVLRVFSNNEYEQNWQKRMQHSSIPYFSVTKKRENYSIENFYSNQTSYTQIEFSTQTFHSQVKLFLSGSLSYRYMSCFLQDTICTTSLIYLLKCHFTKDICLIIRSYWCFDFFL